MRNLKNLRREKERLQKEYENLIGDNPARREFDLEVQKKKHEIDLIDLKLKKESMQ